MIRKDLYVRMIEELGQVLRRAVEQYRSGRKQAARQTVDETIGAFFDMHTLAARNLPEEALFERMTADGPDKREYYRQLADLLLLDGDLLYDEGDFPEAAKAWRQSLRILTWLQANIETVFSFDRKQRLKELAERLSSLEDEV
ncbi:MAG: hypothetical protein KF690_06265 [Bacteroidetes bacterium]|nr:hypothetical protein [Bacteroidota bacterium]